MDIRQSSMNIGTLGHIDHGKTSLTLAITHMWTDRHSESIKRNMTIKLGYADAIISKCSNCEGYEAYTTGKTCASCNGAAEPLMRISMLDAPGHETLMATAIAGASIIDAVLFVIAANEPCPMQQTKEHLMVINILGIKNVIIVQTKVDIVGREKAMESYRQIKEFIKGSTIEGCDIVPVMTNKGINIDLLLEKITNIKIKERDTKSDPLMYIVRSFDVNKPGIDIEKLVGGVIGGAIVKGKFKVGDEIEIRPGIGIQSQKKEQYRPALTTIKSMTNGTDALDDAIAGGLIGIGTDIDPTFVKSDSMVGNVVGHAGKLPESVKEITLKYTMISRPDIEEQPLHEGEPIILGIVTATAVGHVKKVKKDTAEIELNRPVCFEKDTKIAVLRNIAKRWRLTGYGIAIE